MKKSDNGLRSKGLIGILGVFSIVAILLANSAVGDPKNEDDKNPFNAILNITDGLKIQIAQLFAKTDSLQQQVNSIDARNTTIINTVPVPNVTIENNIVERNTTVNIDNNVPVPNVNVENTVPQPNITIVNNVVARGNDTPKVKAFDAFLMIDGVQGESMDERHRGWIDVLSYNHAMSVPVIVGGGVAGRSEHKDFVITKSIDKSSPILALYLNEGRRINEVTIEITRATGDKQKVMEYKLRNVIITSIKINGNAGGDALPTEEISFSYEKIEWTYTTQTGSKIITGWDLAANRAR